MPDPHCASCNGTFVEEIPSEGPDPINTDDPRNFQLDPTPDHEHDHSIPPFLNGPRGPGGFGPGGDPVIHLMNALMGGFTGINPPRNLASPAASGQGNALRFDMTGGRGRVFFTSGGVGTANPPGPGVFEAIGGGVAPSRTGDGPIHPIEGLLAMLTGRPMGGAPGQWGDYVVDQEGLDDIITRLMEQSQGQRPVPAPDDMISKLPRTKVAAESKIPIVAPLTIVLTLPSRCIDREGMRNMQGYV